MPLYYTHIPSPLGPLLAASSGEAISLLSFPTGTKTRHPQPDWHEDAGPFHALKQQLDAYFSGERRAFDVPLAPEGTAFQKRVWDYLLTIPYGETRSYGAIASAFGNPGASRAVGLANGANPLPILQPCHRVIGANGSLTGFAGGMAAKELLLRLEGIPLTSKNTAQLSLF